MKASFKNKVLPDLFMIQPDVFMVLPGLSVVQSNK